MCTTIFLFFLEFQTLKARESSSRLFQDGRQPPSWILADLHECGEHIHLILLVEVLDNTKMQRNLSPKKFPTLGQKWASASGL